MAEESANQNQANNGVNPVNQNLLSNDRVVAFASVKDWPTAPSPGKGRYGQGNQRMASCLLLPAQLQAICRSHWERTGPISYWTQRRLAARPPFLYRAARSRCKRTKTSWVTVAT